MTRSVPGGQRGSSKDPAETSALWGNNSATFHHFIIMSLDWTQLRTHEAHEGKDRKRATEKHEERGVYQGARGSWSFKQDEVWIMKFKKGITQQRSHPHLWDKQKANWSDKGHNRKEKNKPVWHLSFAPDSKATLFAVKRSNGTDFSRGGFQHHLR